tara:strand:+ start:1093 stop:1305 length:213 start_codon:yes stop_codon:yes gene_type:complete
MRINKIQEGIASAQVPAGYAVAGGLGASPLWVAPLTDMLQLIAVLVAVVVGLTTWRLNVLKIKRELRDFD